MQEDKEPVFDTARRSATRLEVMAGALATLRVNAARMRAAADDPLLLATDLAEALVREGRALPRGARGRGTIVAHCLTGERDLRTLSRDELRAFHPAFASERPRSLSVERSLEGRALRGRHGASARARGARRGAGSEWRQSATRSRRWRPTP